MKYTSIILTLFIVHCTLFIAKAQVAINTDNANPDSSAILDIKSTDKGFLYPRMNTAERDAISNPSIGLTIFNLDDKCTDIYDGNAWMKDCPLVLVPDSLINPWTQKADFGGTPRDQAVGFSINGKGYIGTGKDINFHNTKDFWEYDPTSNTWAQKADFPGTARSEAVGFSINDKGYIGTGRGGGQTNDFWEYDPTSDTWTQKANFPGIARDGAVGFSINGKGYIGTGDDGSLKKDFWEYDPISDTWTQKTDFPGTVRYGAVGFSINGKGYIGTGIDENFIHEEDFWEYDPTSDTWTQKADFPTTSRSEAVGFSINGKGYIGTINFTNDFWEYDPTSDTWTQKTDFRGTARDGAVGFSINSKGYIGTGWDNSGRKKDFWEYDPSPSPTYQSSQPSMSSVRNSVLNDRNDDTKIQVEESPNEDVIRFDVTGREAVNMDSDFPLNVIATPSNRHLLKLFTTADTAVWHLRFQGASNKDLGFTETLVANNRLVLAAGGNVGIGTANPSTTLEVNGIVTATSFSGDGSNLTNLNLQDTDADTKIQVEESLDEDVIRFDVAGREVVNMDDDFPLNIIATPSNRHLLKLFTTADTAAWHLRLQGASNKDLGFTETGVLDNRLVLAAGGNVGIGIENPSVALDVNGDIEYTGTITDVSDRRLKENLLPISAVLTKLLQLQAYSYNMVDDAAKTREYGLLAQEVQKVFPELVSNIDAEGEYLGLSYIQLIPILLEGMKEQQAVINQLTTENGALKTQMQTQNQEVKVRLAQIEALLSQKETVETNTIHSEK